MIVIEVESQIRRKISSFIMNNNEKYLIILIVTAVFLCLVKALVLVPDQTADDGKANGNNVFRMFNFASQAAGAIILDQSPSTAKGFNNLLNNDKDKYGISPCSENKWVVIGLSEDILVTSVVMANYEKYSSMLKDFQVLASTSYPTDQWIDLGTYTAEAVLGEQTFNISQMSSAHTRYIKIKFKTHYLDEALCTLSQIKVHGMTVIASLNEEVERESYHMRDVLNDLNIDSSGSEKVGDVDFEAIHDISNDSVTNSTIVLNVAASNVVDSSDRGPNSEIETGTAEPSEGAAATLENAHKISDETTTRLSSSEMENQLTVPTDKEKDAIIYANSNHNAGMSHEVNDSTYSVSANRNVMSGEKIVVIQPDTSEQEVKLDSNGESAEIIADSTTDNLIALCETMSTIPSTDSIFQEVVQFMRSSDNEVTQQQKDDTAASISVALKSLLGIGGELRTLPLAQPKILLAAVGIVKGIFSPLIKSLTSPENAVIEGSTVPATGDTKSSIISDGNDNIKSDPVEKIKRTITEKYSISSGKDTVGTLLDRSETVDVSAISLSDDDEFSKTTSDIAATISAIHKSEYLTLDIGSNQSLVELHSSIVFSEETENVTVPLGEATKNCTISDENISGIINLIQNFSTLTSHATPVVKLINMSAVSTGATDEVNYIQPENITPVEDMMGESIAKIESKVPAEHESIVNSTIEKFIAKPKPALDNSTDTDTLSTVHQHMESAVLNLTSDIGNEALGSNTTILSHSTHAGSLSTAIIATDKLNVTTSLNISSMGPIFEKPNLTCFETLNYTEFHSKMKTKLQIKGGTMSESSQELSKDNNVFKAMMQRIKHLEMNDAIVEMFTNQMVDCYRTITREYLKTSDLEILTAQLEKSLDSLREASTIDTSVHQNQHHFHSFADKGTEKTGVIVSILDNTNSTVEDAPKVLILLNDSISNAADSQRKKGPSPISDSADKFWSFKYVVDAVVQHIVRVLRNNGIEVNGDLLSASESFVSFLEKKSIFICLCSLLVTVLSLCTSVMCLIVTVLMFISRGSKK